MHEPLSKQESGGADPLVSEVARRGDAAFRERSLEVFLLDLKHNIASTEKGTGDESAMDAEKEMK